jgi:hypothetical protein
VAALRPGRSLYMANHKAYNKKNWFQLVNETVR